MSRFIRGFAAAAAIAIIATSVWTSSPGASIAGPGAWMGVRVVPLSEGWREQYSYYRAGVRVVEVEPDSKADQIGIVAGDILVTVGSTSLKKESDLAAAQSRVDLNTSIPVVIARYNGTVVKIRNMEPTPVPEPELAVEPFAPAPEPATETAPEVKAGVPPETILRGPDSAAVDAEPESDPDPLTQLGVQCVDLNQDLASVLGASKDEGVLVFKVTPGGIAHRAGIRGGDVITAAGDKAVGSVEALARALKAAPSGITLHVLRRSDEREVTVALVAPPPAPAATETAKEKSSQEAVEQELRSLRQELEELKAEIAAKNKQD